MKNYSVVRFGDSINNVITGPSVANFDLLDSQAHCGIKTDTHLVTYKEKSKKLKYPNVKMHEVSLEISKEVASRMPLQPHFKTVDKALSFVPKLKDRIIAVAVSGRYSPQAYQFVNLVNKNYSKKAYLVVEGHGSDVCGYQLREFENLYRNIYKSADLVILEETPIAKYYFKKEKFPVGNMAVLPTIVYWEPIINRIKKNHAAIKEVRKKYEKQFGIPTNANLIMTNGRFQPEKGHKYLALAAKEVLKKHPDTYFALGGSGSGTEKEIKGLINKIDPKKIKLIGHIPYDYYHQLIASSTCYVIPSVELWKNGKLYFAETGPRTVIDGMSATNVGNVVVLASNSGGTSWKLNMDEWLKNSIKLGASVPKFPKYKKIQHKKGISVENAKNRALLFDQANPNSIAAAINIILEDPGLRKKINRESRRYVNKWYGSKRMTLEYKKLIESLLN
jgi:glycosyltransferase involved in cell wall biosynthesis